MLYRLCGPALLLLAGCAHVTTECATHGGPEWAELTSMHFVVRTDLPADEAKATVEQLEHVRTAILPALLGVPFQEQPLEVVVLRGKAPVAPDALADGLFVRDWRGPVLVLEGDTSLLDARSRLSVLAHELSHHYSGRALQRRPRWLSEGLAAYLETLSLDRSARQAIRGRANQDRLADVERWGLLPIESLWAWDELHDERPGLEQHRLASAWFWVHYLFNEQRPRLERFFAALGEGLEPRAAWGRVFAELPPEKLGAAADAWVAKRELRTQRIELSDVAVTARRLPDAQVHAVLARVAAATGAWERAKQEVSSAEALAPEDALVQEQAVVNATPQTRLSRARGLVDARPTLGGAWALLALSLPASDERAAALARAVELDPTLFVAQTELARARCLAGACQDGVALAEKALAAAPDDVRALTSVAAVFSLAGQCERARAVQQHAFEVLPHGASGALRTKLEQARARLCN
ncbi:MAG: DUF1570 domain-containing protein [Myxococcota bacterium]